MPVAGHARRPATGLRAHATKAALYGGHGQATGEHPHTGSRMPQSDFSDEGSAAGNEPRLESDYGIVDTSN
jgi:hypothetical protein